MKYVYLGISILSMVLSIWSWLEPRYRRYHFRKCCRAHELCRFSLERVDYLGRIIFIDKFRGKVIVEAVYPEREQGMGYRHIITINNLYPL